MAIDFKEKLTELQEKEKSGLTDTENLYVDLAESYIDSKIEKDLSTDKTSVWIDKGVVDFKYNPINGEMFPEMTSSRRKFLQDELLSRYEKSNWEIDWHIDDGLDGPNMSGGDYLILKGKR